MRCCSTRMRLLVKAFRYWLRPWLRAKEANKRPRGDSPSCHQNHLRPGEESHNSQHPFRKVT